MRSVTTLPSPVGRLTLASDGESLIGLWLDGQKYFGAGLPDTVQEKDLSVFREAEAWLKAYFAKAPLPALPPLAPQGSSFRQAVWQLLLEIPYGTVTTYGALAQKLRDRGISAAAQAVGGAVGHNPISILIPCHRVVGSDGSLTGYAGGVAKKQFLLELEGVDMAGLYVPPRGTALCARLLPACAEIKRSGVHSDAASRKRRKRISFISAAPASWRSTRCSTRGGQTWARRARGPRRRRQRRQR